MVKNSKVSALVLAMLLGSVSGLASAAFVSGMTTAQISAEVSAQLGAHKTLAQIAEEAKAAGMPASALTAALIAAGQDAAFVAQDVAFIYPQQQRNSIIEAAMAGASDDKKREIGLRTYLILGTHDSDVGNLGGPTGAGGSGNGNGNGGQAGGSGLTFSGAGAGTGSGATGGGSVSPR